MGPTLQELKAATSGLPVGERAELAQFLLRSLDDEDAEGVRADWPALAEQRMAEVRAGKVVGVPAEIELAGGHPTGAETLADLLSGITPENLHVGWGDGPPVGKELL